MSPSEFDSIFRQVIAECSLLLGVKGGEYADSSDRLSNFKESARRMHILPEKSLLILADKHWASICNYIHDIELGGKRTYSEPIHGRLNDLINYMILLRGLLEERNSLALAAREERRNLEWEGE